MTPQDAQLMKKIERTERAIESTKKHSMKNIFFFKVHRSKWPITVNKANNKTTEQTQDHILRWAYKYIREQLAKIIEISLIDTGHLQTQGQKYIFMLLLAKGKGWEASCLWKGKIQDKEYDF